MSWSYKRLRINGRYLNNLWFADDVIIFAETPKVLEEILREFESKCKEAGLEMNRQNCKIMTNGEHKPIGLGGTLLEYVEDFIYLGQVMSFKNNQDMVIEQRINKSWKKFWSLKFIMKSDPCLKLKSKRFNTATLPTLTYGSQTWSLPKAQVNKRKVTKKKRAIERSMLKISKKDRIRIIEIQDRTGVEDVITKIKKNGHELDISADYQMIDGLKQLQSGSRWTKEGKRETKKEMAR
ncbi:unnamed protein product [Parnassius mnemosyne]|uniref:Reverse transcriptase domain-containing protein n=1 Tax=Parnassius mnemosyne TaxID=213953 RepID=A0AAV1KF13_9NEOP